MIKKYRPSRRHLVLASVLSCCALVVGGNAFAHATDFPNRPLRIVVPFPPGGSTDALGRLLADEMSKELGQPVVVENKGGAGGDIGSITVARAQPDGYTMLLVSSGFIVNPTMYETQYDPIKDFDAISLVAEVPSLLVVNSQSGAKTLSELVEQIRSTPDKPFNFASTGIGSVQHLAGELFNLEGKLEMSHVPYNGAGPAISAILGDHINMLVASVPALKAQVEAGSLRALANTMRTRLTTFPDVPTFIEAGFPSVVATQIQGILVPAGTPAPVVKRLSEVIVGIVRRPEIDKQLQIMGFLPVASSPEEFNKEIEEQTKTWGDVVRTAKIKPQ